MPAAFHRVITVNSAGGGCSGSQLLAEDICTIMIWFLVTGVAGDGVCGLENC